MATQTISCRDQITPQRLRALLDYDPGTGNFVWRVPLTRRVKVGAVAGSLLRRPCTNYRQISIGGHPYLAHRLAWLYVTGEWPTAQIDHVNGDGTDNRFCNLREATRSQNGGNRRANRNNASGYKGVAWHVPMHRWRAQIKIGGRKIYIGCFDTPEAAHAAYVAAALEHFGEYARAS